MVVSCSANRIESKQTGVHDTAEFVLRHKLFDELLKKEEFMDAANCLGKLNLDASSGKVCGPQHYNIARLERYKTTTLQHTLEQPCCLVFGLCMDSCWHCIGCWIDRTLRAFCYHTIPCHTVVMVVFDDAPPYFGVYSWPARVRGGSDSCGVWYSSWYTSVDLVELELAQ